MAGHSSSSILEVYVEAVFVIILSLSMVTVLGHPLKEHSIHFNGSIPNVIIMLIFEVIPHYSNFFSSKFIWQTAI